MRFICYFLLKFHSVCTLSLVLVISYSKLILLLNYSILDCFDRGAADYVLLHLGFCLSNQNWFVNCVLQICNQHGFSSLIKTHMGV